jgi:DNA-binding CsgD family transcriptional regulator
MPKTRVTDITGAIEATSTLIGYIGKVEFPEALVRTMRDLIPQDTSLVLGAARGGGPVMLAEQMGKEERPSFFGPYMSGAYMLAPGFRTAQDTDFSGIGLLRDIFPGDMKNSKYFYKYWGHTGMIDEVFQFIRLNNERVIWICAGRYEHSRRFRKSELNLLEIAEPLIREAVCRHWNERPFDPDDMQETAPNHDRFRQSLDDFGARVLSPREHEVCQLLLRGHSSKSAARVLTISPETERIHRRRVYGKLNVSSQVEVMAKFMTALTSNP